MQTDLLKNYGIGETGLGHSFLKHNSKKELDYKNRHWPQIYF
jgi:hypothetical protein